MRLRSNCRGLVWLLHFTTRRVPISTITWNDTCTSLKQTFKIEESMFTFDAHEQATPWRMLNDVGHVQR